MAAKINYEFKDLELYKLALTHSSASQEQNNERLELLGDAVLDLIVTEYIYAEYPDSGEGELAQMRAGVVSSESLAGVGVELELGSELILGRGEKKNGGQLRPSNLADAVEAVIAAIYLDGGMEAIRPLVLEWLESRILESASNPGREDYKSRLQELLTRLSFDMPYYSVTSEGPDHQKLFSAIVEVEGKKMGSGQGPTKRAAEQLAAMQAYKELSN